LHCAFTFVFLRSALFTFVCHFQGGMWLLNLVDYSVSGFPLLFVGLFECVALNWIYRKYTYWSKLVPS